MTTTLHLPAAALQRLGLPTDGTATPEQVTARLRAHQQATGAVRVAPQRPQPPAPAPEARSEADAIYAAVFGDEDDDTPPPPAAIVTFEQYHAARGHQPPAIETPDQLYARLFPKG